ncbi:hypothetical protein FNF27_01681 [Cafeteria roenbergensis]|uniref:Endosomal/lysosomal proton channel TMEM175 n=2 Tax=Cafeteria roenbergensis TaxID=33653 RepID=A0A5A8EGZ6_CAFRO|nr:hypothetical protein FNF27_01681 [Cafeteria roenbergensis]
MPGPGPGAFTAAEKASSLFEHERVGAFADAILAIFATVAAVPLAKVEVEPPEDGGELSAWDVLEAKATNMLLYMITFAIVGSAFVDSMRLTHRARVMRRRAMVPFVFFLLSTSLIPLGFILTQSSRTSQPDPLAITAYFALMILSKMASLVLRCVLRPVLRVEYPMQDAVETCTAVAYMFGCLALIGVSWMLSALHATASLVWYATPCLGFVARMGPSFLACCCRQEVAEAKSHIRIHGRWLLDRERMAAFTDGVLAISATFTLLEIRAPASLDGVGTASPVGPSRGLGEPEDGGFATYIQHHWRDLLSYAASFSVILQLWVTHRETTSAVPRFGKVLRSLNLLSCMVAALIPFSMSLVVNFPDDATASVFSLVVVAVSSGAMALLPVMGRWWMRDLQGIPLLSLELFEEEEEEEEEEEADAEAEAERGGLGLREDLPGRAAGQAASAAGRPIAQRRAGDPARPLGEWGGADEGSEGPGSLHGGAGGERQGGPVSRADRDDAWITAALAGQGGSGAGAGAGADGGAGAPMPFATASSREGDAGAALRAPGEVRRGRSVGEDSYYGFLVEDDPGADSKTDGRDMARAARQLRAAAVRPGSVLPEAAEEDGDGSDTGDARRFSGGYGGGSTARASPLRSGAWQSRAFGGRDEVGDGADGLSSMAGGGGALGEALLVRHGGGGYHPKTLPAALEEHLVRLLAARALVLPAVALLVIPVVLAVPGIGLLLLPLVWVVVGAIGWAEHSLRSPRAVPSLVVRVLLCWTGQPRAIPGVGAVYAMHEGPCCCCFALRRSRAALCCNPAFDLDSESSHVAKRSVNEARKVVAAAMAQGTRVPRPYSPALPPAAVGQGGSLAGTPLQTPDAAGSRSTARAGEIYHGQGDDDDDDDDGLPLMIAQSSRGAVDVGRSTEWAGSLLVVAALGVLRPLGGLASNFAQLSGTERQRTASTTRTGWTARYGAAVAVKENPRVADGVELPERERSRLYLLGGDDYLLTPGSGGYRNDVWYTTGESNIAVNSVVEKNQFGAALPRIVSTTSWVESLDQTPPQGIGYKEWLCCLPEVNWECDFVSCSPIDPFQGQRRWSPRRDHAAVTVKNLKLFVMGGRARALEDIPAAEAIGGIIPPRGRWRERSILMGDVWMSTDGEDWSLVTPGCYVHQPGIVPGKGLPVQRCRSTLECWSKKLGPTRCNNGVCECTMWSPREQFAAAAVDSELFVMGGRTYMPLQACGAYRCGTEYTRFLDDVWRSSDDGRTWEQLKPLGNGQWAPRAGFGLAVAGGYFWLAAGRGGATTDYTSNPLFNDVWRSTDGVTWTQNVTSAPWRPRTNAQLVGSGQTLLLIGGSVEVPPLPSPSPLPAAGQAAAAAAQAPVHRILGSDPSPSPLPTLEGETVSGIRLLPVDEVWTFDIGSTTATNEWLRDYRPGTPQTGYVGLNTTVEQAFNLSSAEGLAMRAAGTATVYALSAAPARTVRKLRLGQTTPAWPNGDGSQREACFFVKWAQAITELCETRRRPFDGEYAVGITIIEGSVAAAALRSGATVDSLVSEATQRTTLERLETDEELGGLTGCDDRAEEITLDPRDTDVVCKELPAARESHSAAEMDGKVYVMAGYERQSTSAADAWYRDPVLPGTVITQAPRSSTSETIFEFAASEEACIFEWRIFELPGLVKATVPGTGVEVRNWTRQLPPVDIVDFIYAGFFRVEVRAVDPAGNRDQTSLPGVNVYAWEYVPPIPWGWIILGIILGLLFLIFGLYYYRRYRRRKAMERYAQQRIKRKIKAVAEGDWRNAYQGGKKKKKRKGKSKKRTERERRAKEGGKDGKRKRKGADDDKKKSKKKKKGKKDKKDKKGKKGAKGKKGKKL